jgi:hypothetical protein
MSVIELHRHMADLLVLGTELLRWLRSSLADISHTAAAVQAPLLVEQGLLRSMEHALWRDTSFLAGLGVMDYSLLVGECAVYAYIRNACYMQTYK